jgi:bacteriocin-like protein
MKTISTNDLATVTGGKAPATSLGSTTGDTGSSNEQVLSALQGIQSSLKDLGKNQNQGLFGGTNGLLFMTMALALSRRSEVVVANGSYHGRRGSFSWRVGW